MANPFAAFLQSVGEVGLAAVEHQAHYGPAPSPKGKKGKKAHKPEGPTCTPCAAMARLQAAKAATGGR